MLAWIPALPEVAIDAASLLLQTSCPPIQHANGILYSWRQDDRFVRGHPDAAAAVIQFLSERRSIESWDVDNAVLVLEAASEAGADRAGLVRSADALAAATTARAAIELAARLRGGT